MLAGKVIACALRAYCLQRSPLKHKSLPPPETGFFQKTRFLKISTEQINPIANPLTQLLIIN